MRNILHWDGYRVVTGYAYGYNGETIDSSYVSTNSGEITFLKDTRAFVVYSVAKAGNTTGNTLTPKLNGNNITNVNSASLSATKSYRNGAGDSSSMQNFIYNFKAGDVLSFYYQVPDSGYNLYDVRVYAVGGGSAPALNDRTFCYKSEYVYTGSPITVSCDVSKTNKIYYRIIYGTYTNSSTSVSSTNNIIPSGTSTRVTSLAAAGDLFAATLQEADVSGINTLDVTFTSSGGNYGSYAIFITDSPW